MPQFFAYIRRSNGKIDAENQRFEILRHEEAGSLHETDQLQWVEEKVTGNSNHDDRQLGTLIDGLRPDDVLFVADVSRLGRRSLDVMEQGAKIMKAKARLICCLNNLELKDDIGSELKYYALSLGARIERENISARTKAALRRRKAAGVKLGRPKGATSTNAKLAAHESDIRTMLENKVSQAAIARTFKVSRDTVRKFVRELEPA